MRSSAGPGLLLLAALAGGCDSNQPALVGSQGVTLDFRANSATTTNNRTWLMFEDSDQNGTPDDVNADGSPDTFLWCEDVPDVQGGGVSPSASPPSVPWNFVVTVKILRPGETVPTVVAQNLESSPARAQYDQTAPPHFDTLALSGVQVTHPNGRCSTNPNIPCNPNETASTLCSDNAAGTCTAVGTCAVDGSPCTVGVPGRTTCERQGLGSCDVPDVTRRFAFLNEETRRQMSSANEELLRAPPNILFLVDSAVATQLESGALGAISSGGICPGDYLGPPTLGGMTLPVEFQLAKGSTLIVEARRLEANPGGGIPFLAAPGLTASFTVSGAQANVVGNLSAGSGPAEFIQFFYLSQ